MSNCYPAKSQFRTDSAPYGSAGITVIMSVFQHDKVAVNRH